MLSNWTGYNTVSQGDNYGAFGDRNRNYKQVFKAGQKIGRWAKRMFDQKKARASKTASRRKPASNFRAATGRQVALSGGDSSSFFKLVQKATSKTVELAKESSVSSLIQNTAGRTEAAVGVQNYTIIGDYFTDTDLNLGHQLLAGNVAGGAQGVKTVFESLYSECMIVNQSNSNARITLYDVFSRKDTDGTAADPYEAIVTGYNDIVNGTANDSSVVGGTPYSIPRFTEYFKILKQTAIVLSPGACHVHKVHYSPNRLISKQLSARISGSGVGGLTLYTLMKYHGTPLNDVTTQTQVSTSQISLDWVNHEEYKLKMVNTSIPFTDVNNVLPTSFTVAGATMQDDGVELAANEA